MGGAGVSVSYASTTCALGLIMIGATDRGICFLQFGDTEQELLNALRAEFPKADLRAMEKPYPPAFAEWKPSETPMTTRKTVNRRRVDNRGTASRQTSASFQK